MTLEELTANLRDIHLPEQVSSSQPLMFAPEPFVVLALVIGLIVAVRWWRRQAWRRQARRRLSAILNEPSASDRWTALVGLYQASAAHVPQTKPDPALFLPPERIGAAETDSLAAAIRRLTG